MDFATRMTAALNREFPYTERKFPLPDKPSQVRQAAVLALFGHAESGGSEDPALLVTKRSEKVESHRGQMAFPGGIEEDRDTTLIDTALRETEEETGIVRSQLSLLGQMPMLPTITTGFKIQPVVGVLNQPIEQVQLKLSEDEVAEVVWVPLSTLLDTKTYQTQIYKTKYGDFPTHVFQVGPHRIWGATAAIIRNLLDRLLAS